MPCQVQRYVVVLLACHFVAPFHSLLLFLSYHQESERDLPSLLPSTPDGWSDASTVSFATPPLTNEDSNRVGFMKSERERVLQSDASPGAKVRCCYISCLSFGISFLLTSLVSFVPTGG